MLSRFLCNASTGLSLTGCLCFKALSLALWSPSSFLPPSVLVPIPQIAQRPRSVLQTLPAYRDGLARLLSHSRITLSCLALSALRSWQHTIRTVTLLPPLNRSLPLHLSFTCPFTSHLSFGPSAHSFNHSPKCNTSLCCSNTDLFSPL